MKDYQIVMEDSEDAFEQSVNKKLEDGLVLVGGVSIASGATGTIWYAQAFARPVA